MLHLNIPPPILANLLMCRVLHRSNGVTLQAIEFRILARLLGGCVARGSADVTVAGGVLLGSGLLLGLGRLAAGVGCRHLRWNWLDGNK